MRSGNVSPGRASVADDGSVWADVVGQDRAVDALRRAAAAPVHAYLFVGPPGSTKDEAARAFAALLLTGSETADTRDARLALAGEHPDVREVVRVGPAIAAEQAAEIVRQAALAPVEGDAQGADPPRVPPAQRRRRRPTPEDDRGAAGVDALHRARRLRARRPRHDRLAVRAHRVLADRRAGARRPPRRRGQQRRSTPPRRRPQPAATSTRARLLAADPQFAERRRTFAELPRVLDGTGATVVAADDRPARPHRGGGRSARRAPGARARRARRARAAARHAVAAGGRRSRRGTSASCGGTAPTSCAAVWRRSPRPTATRSSTAPRRTTMRSSPRSTASTPRSSRSSTTPTRR